jgi:hypothetical protein
MKPVLVHHNSLAKLEGGFIKNNFKTLYLNGVKELS